MKKKILGMLCGVLVLGALTGCGNNNDTTGNGGDVSGGGTSTNTKGNCTAVECIKKISPENTVEQIKLLEKAGCEIVRVACLDIEDAKAIKEIKKQINIPIQYLLLGTFRRNRCKNGLLFKR